MKYVRHDPNAGWCVVVAVAVFIAFGIYVVNERDPNRNVDTERLPYRQMILKANEQIAAESRGRGFEPSISAPVRRSKVLRGNPAPQDTASQPPDGYSFVTFHGEMSKGRLEGRHKRKGELPREQLDWLGSPIAIEELVAQAVRAKRDWSFGWVRMAENVNLLALETTLRGTGAEVIGASGRLIRVKLPRDKARLSVIAALPQIDGIGAIPPAIKLHSVEQAAAEMATHARIPVFVTLMSSDPDNQWRIELEKFGAVVGRYDPTIRTYAISASYDALKAIAVADFVAAIEPVGIVKAAHDTAVPAMGADGLRTYTGTPGFFSGIGGVTTPIAVMDTGLNTNHLDIASNRSSICGANFVSYEPRVDEHDLWVDAGIHGTHVTGTIVGNGTSKPHYTGMAPLVQHIRFAKVLNHAGFGNDIFILNGMDFLAESTSCPEFSMSTDRVKPLIVNMSLSASARIHEGRGVAERKLDSIVWRHRQLYVVAQSNEGISGFSNYGTAKNSLAVGAVLDSGSLAGFSSHGPTADGRLAPKVVGAGVNVFSAAGDGSSNGYRKLSGTSMASPAVAGVAAMLMDAVHFKQIHVCAGRTLTFDEQLLNFVELVTSL